MPPKSLGSPQRRAGTRGITFSANAGEACAPAVMSVAIQPGRIEFARTPSRANSTAMLFIIEITAPLVAA